MTRDTLHERLRPSDGADRARWINLVNDDATGIDGDVAKLTELWQAKYRYTRGKATTELVRRLSSLARTGLLSSDARD